MRITIEGLGQLDVDVVHSQKPGFVNTKQLQEGYAGYSAKTTCTIRVVNGSEDHLLGQGVAYCAVGDNFQRRLGAGHALSRAMNEANFSRELRAKIGFKFWNGKFGAKKKAKALVKSVLTPQNYNAAINSMSVADAMAALEAKKLNDAINSMSVEEAMKLNTAELLRD